MTDPALPLRFLSPRRARCIRLPQRHDARGSLLPMEFADLPFAPCRAFIVHDVPAGSVRGRHAHRSARQLLVCLAGRVDVELRDDDISETVTLDAAQTGLVIEAGVWAAQTYVSAGSMLLVLSSEPFDLASYVGEPHRLSSAPHHHDIHAGS